MTTTTPTNIDSSIPELWAKRALREERVKGFWGRWTGPEGSDAPIVLKSELKGPGDLMHIQVTSPLTGAGQEGDTSVVEGNEENLSSSKKSVSPILYRHGVANYRRAEKKSILELRQEARSRLREWAANKIDTKRFENFVATVLPAPLAAEAYTPNQMILAAADGADAGTVVADTVDDITATDTLTVKAIQLIKLKLRLLKAKPVMVDGFPVYFYVTHPNSTFQLKQEARYESWVREAQVRGDGNPFFKGALAMIDGVVLFDHENVPTASNTAAVKYAKGIAFGANAFVEGMDEDVQANEDTFDYGNRLGYEIRFAFQPRRALELSSLQVLTVAKDVV